MEVLLERLVVELVVVGVELALLRLLAWIRHELGARSDGVALTLAV